MPMPSLEIANTGHGTEGRSVHVSRVWAAASGQSLVHMTAHSWTLTSLELTGDSVTSNCQSPSFVCFPAWEPARWERTVELFHLLDLWELRRVYLGACHRVTFLSLCKDTGDGDARKWEKGLQEVQTLFAIHRWGHSGKSSPPHRHQHLCCVCCTRMILKDDLSVLGWSVFKTNKQKKEFIFKILPQ